MLTKQQVINLANQHGMTYGVKILPESPLFNNKQCLVDFANAAFALGVAHGRDRLLSEDFLYNAIRGLGYTTSGQTQELVDAIRARK